MATPALRAIRERFPAARITFLMQPNLRDLVRGGNWMNECLEWPNPSGARSYFHFVWELRKRRFDWAILLPNSFRAAWIAWWSGARRRIGYDRDGRGWLLTDPIPVRNRSLARVARRVAWSRAVRPWYADGTVSHGLGDTFSRREAVARAAPTIPDRSEGRFLPIPLVEYYADLVEAIGCRRPGDRLELFTTPDEDASIESRLGALGLSARHPLVVISPGAKYGAAKCWPPERFAEVGDRLIEALDAAIVVTCGPGEEPIARSIVGSMHHGGVSFDDPPLSLGELKSLIRRCDLWIGNDAGPRHVAKAFGVPVVTVFGPTHPQWTATRYPAERIVRIDVECGPCQRRICPLGHHQCMTGVSVDAVFAAARLHLFNGFDAQQP
jgi:heptosyltransferase-2